MVWEGRRREAPPYPDLFGTDRRSALPRQQSQVSEENRTRQRGTWKAAATAESDPELTSERYPFAMQQTDAMCAENW